MDWQMLQEYFAWYLPVVGLGAVFVLAACLRGAARRMTLAVGPFLVGLAMWRVGATIDTGIDWLLGLAHLLLYGLGYLAILVHYVALLPAAIAGWLQRNERMRRERRAEAQREPPPLPRS